MRSGDSYTSPILGNDDVVAQRGSSPPTSLPGYIDPSQIYNPYRLDYERMKAAEAAAELKRQRDAEAEAEASRKREEEVKQKEEAELEAHRRGEAEAEVKARRENEAEAKRQRINIPEMRRKVELARETKIASRRQNPKSSAEQPCNLDKSTDSNLTSNLNTVTSTKRSLKSSRKRTASPSSSRKLPKEKGSSSTSKAIPTTKSIGGHDLPPSHGDSTPYNGSALSTQGPSEEEDIALEMKQMVEKMRVWKSKDPALFAKFLDGVKTVRHFPLKFQFFLPFILS
jgi:hypothetical protein